MHKNKGKTKAREVHTSTLKKVKYTDTKKDDLSLLVNAALQVEFGILVLRESHNLRTWKEVRFSIDLSYTMNNKNKFLV